MPVYRYFFEDLTTGILLDELPGLYGTYMSGNLSQPGDWTGTIRMDTDYRKPADILDVTMPGRTVLWCERDTQLIWGGILWSRTYQSDGRTMQMQARTFDAYLGKDYCDVDLALTDYKTNIVREAFQRAFEVGSNAPVGLLDIPAAVGSDGGSTITKTLVGIDYTPWNDVVNEYTRSGVEYRIRYFKDALGNRHAALDLGRWDLGPTLMIGVPSTAGAERLVFQYPGEIAKYWFSESAAQAVNVLAGIGKANDASTPRVVVTNTDSLTSGYPRMRKRFTYSETESVSLLTTTLNAIKDSVAPPIVNPTFALQSGPGTEDAQFGNWNLGDYFDFVLDDPYRFPNVRKGCTRVSGWGLTPGGSEGVESVALTTTNYNAQITEAGE